MSGDSDNVLGPQYDDYGREPVDVSAPRMTRSGRTYTMCAVKEIQPNDPIWSSDLTKAAIAKELKGLQDRKTARFSNP